MIPRIIPQFCVLLALTASAGAASVSFSTYTATGPSDTSWVITTSGAASANFGGGDTIFGGVNWEGSTSNGHPDSETYVSHAGYTISHRSPTQWGGNSSGFYPANSSLGILNTGTTAGTGGTINLSGLVVGQNYIARFVFVRGFSNTDTVTIDPGTGNTGALPSTRFGYDDGRYLVVTATWQADSTDISFVPKRSGFQASTLNAAQIVAVPEPSVSSLLGVVLGIGVLHRRRMQSWSR